MKNKGFTLVELLAVLILISLILVIVVPSVQSISAKSKMKLCNTKVELIEKAMDIWASNNQNCITKSDNGCGLLTCKEGNNDITCTTTIELLAENNIINYDEDDKNVLNPIDNSYINDETLTLKYNKTTHDFSSKIEAIKNICSANNVKEPEKDTNNNSNPISSSTNPSTKPIEQSTNPTNPSTKPIEPSTNPTNPNTICNSFADDDWETISQNVKNGDTKCYTVGATKCIKKISDYESGFDKECANDELEVRLVNNSNYDCPVESESACGFVVEFSGIITNIGMHEYDENVGYPNSLVKTKIKEIFSNLPDELKKAIAPTKFISGHGSKSRNSEMEDGNWESTEELYLLNAGEIYSDCLTSETHCYDTSSNTSLTRQLDYYSENNVKTDNNYLLAAKKHAKDTVMQNYITNASWLRSAKSYTKNEYLAVGAVSDVLQKNQGATSLFKP